MVILRRTKKIIPFVKQKTCQLLITPTKTPFTKLASNRLRWHQEAVAQLMVLRKYQICHTGMTRRPAALKVKHRHPGIRLIWRALTIWQRPHSLLVYSDQMLNVQLFTFYLFQRLLMVFFFLAEHPYEIDDLIRQLSIQEFLPKLSTVKKTIVIQVPIFDSNRVNGF